MQFDFVRFLFKKKFRRRKNSLFFFIRNLLYRIYFRTITKHINFNKVQLEEILALIMFSYNYQ